MKHIPQLDTKNEYFRDILSNGKKYVVPRFQRDYSWSESHWADWWADISWLRESNEYHYMGYLVLKKKDDMTFVVIDGQQRLTTFSLLVLAAIKRLREISPNVAGRVDALRTNFIGAADLVNLRTENKLKLNRNNDYYYREAVEGKGIPNRIAKGSVRLMRKALNYFYDKLGDITNEVEISELIQLVAQRMLFTTIYVGDELSAYSVFETLNARGVKLSSSDLLKNYLFSIMDPQNDTPDEVLDEVDQQWDRIGEQIGGRNYSEYILVQWNSTHKLTRASQLFKALRSEVVKKKHVRDYLTTLTQQSQFYGAVFDGYNEFWKDYPEKESIKRDLNCLRLFSVRQPHSLLLAAHENLREDFHRVLERVKILSLRLAICGIRAPERTYNEICLKIGDGHGLSEITDLLRRHSPSDDQFRTSFQAQTIHSLTTDKQIRYLLARLEEYHANQSKHSIDETALTVEHVLPSNPNAEWTEYFGADWDTYKDQIGNVALVGATMNRELGQRSFAEKKRILSKAEYELSRAIADLDGWGSEEIQVRQKKLADIAVQLWRL